MSPSQSLPLHRRDPSLNAALDLLGLNSYTTRRLQHADAEHLHRTSRRCFVGPIPEGWLKTHRKQWYKHYLGIHHSSKAPTFTAANNVGSRRQVTGIEENSSPRQSFPQPSDVTHHISGDQALDSLGQVDSEQAVASHGSSPSVPLPSSYNNDESTPAQPSSGSDAATIIPTTSESALSTTTSRQSESDAVEPKKERKKRASKSRKPRLRREESAASYKTANEYLDDDEESIGTIQEDEEGSDEVARLESNAQDVTVDHVSSYRPSAEGPSQLTGSPALSGRDGSTAPLLDMDHVRATNDQAGTTTTEEANNLYTRIATESTKRNIQFDIDQLRARFPERRIRSQLAHIGLGQGRILSRHRGGDGQIVKMEKMLLRIDLAIGSDQPEADYSEVDSQHIETRVVERWREFMVVCRECNHDDAVLVLELYQTRVIPASNRDTKRHYKYQIYLDRKKVGVSLYSTLDKTIAICTKEKYRTKIHYLRTRSNASSSEWFNFFRQALGKNRDRTIRVNIPGLNANVRLEDPFSNAFSKAEIEKAAAGDEEMLVKLAQFESSVAQTIVDRCLQKLAEGDEWKDVLGSWISHNRIGLAWRRYDRLEWIHGEHERRMYGAYGMLRSHELELRAKQHYPQSTKTRSGETIPEPPPVEGFLVRLTSQKGTQKTLGKFFYKRLYYTTQNQFLLFLKPKKAVPPPPPDIDITKDSAIPTAEQLSDKIPLIYAVNPFPLKNGEISWLTDRSPEAAAAHDAEARDESRRNTNLLHTCDGFINLCNIDKVRGFTRAGNITNDEIGGTNVDFDEQANDTGGPDGMASSIDQDRTFELVLNNGLVVRLQAFNKATKDEWMQRLQDLSTYWRHRITADTDRFKQVRAENLRALNVDERAEAYIGQFAQKWEVKKSFASAELYHMCGISSCRAVHNAGVLYRKPRIHATFHRCYAILCSGHLIIFQDTMRTVTGKTMPHIQHERIASIDLSTCYLYSGLITEDDLLYQNRSFDPDAPGQHALPRVFLEDSWTSTDEDAMTTFVIWHGQKKGWFRNREIDDVKNRDKKGHKARQTLHRVNQLGTKGRSIVFKARSRAERDHWVSTISAEIEKYAKDDGVRVVKEGDED